MRENLCLKRLKKLFKTILFLLILSQIKQNPGQTNMVFCVTLFRLIFTGALLLSGAFYWEIFLLKGANYQYPTISAFVDYSYAPG